MPRIALLWGPSARSSTRTLVLIAVMSVCAFHVVPMTVGSFDQGDWGHHWHYYDWTRTSLTRYRTLPLFMCDASHTPNFVANAQSPIFGPFVWLLYILSTGTYIKLLIVVYSVVGFASMLALLQDLDIEVIAALPVAVVFTFNGYFISHISLGHHWVLGSYLLPAIVLAFRRGIAGSPGAVWIAASINVVAIFEGQHHPFLWNTGFTLIYAIGSSTVERSWKAVRLWLAFLGASLSLAAIKLFPMFTDFSGYAPRSRFPGIPVGRLPSVLWHTLFTTADAASPGFPPPYRFTESFAPFDVGWWEYDFHVGVGGIIVLALGILWLFRHHRPIDRRALPWMIAGLPFFLISLRIEPAIFEPWWWIEDLPLLSSQRCPSRFLIVAVTAFAVAAALGLQSALEGLWRSGRRWGAPVGRVLLVVASIVIYVDLYRTAAPLELHAVGPEIESLDHRFGEAPAPEFASLVRFEPNRLSYAANNAQRGARPILLPIPDRECYLSRAAERLPMPAPGRFLSEWTVDGADARMVAGRWLAIDRPAGGRQILVRYRPVNFGTGAVVSGATAVIAVVWGSFAHSRRRQTLLQAPHPNR